MGPSARLVLLLTLWIVALSVLTGCRPVREPGHETSARVEVGLLPARVNAVVGEGNLGYPIRYEEAICPFLFEFDNELFGGDRDIDLVAVELTAIRCGYMTVPQDRHAPDGLQVETAVAILAGSGENLQPEPLLFLTGGPGAPSVREAIYWLESELRTDRDIILVDQRGTGYSRPNLSCPEVVYHGDPDYDYYVGLAACRERLLALGVDLTLYHTAVNAHDLADLRQILGIESWHVMGGSYGSRLALTLLREHPEGIRSLILDSVSPPNTLFYVELVENIGSAIHTLLESCEASRGCRRAYPNLTEKFYELLASRYEQPVYFLAQDIFSSHDLEIDVFYFLDSVLWGLYDSYQIPLLPMMIAHAYDDDYRSLIYDFILGPVYLDDPESEEDGRADRGEFFIAPEIESVGMHYAVECYDHLASTDLDLAAARAENLNPLLRELLLWRVYDFLEVCSIWLPETVAESMPEPVYSDVPVLLLAGEFDPVTPPKWARLAGETLPNHFYVELPRGGHGVAFFNACFVNIVRGFLAAPEISPDARCVQRSVFPFAVRPSQPPVVD